MMEKTVPILERSRQHLRQIGTDLGPPAPVGPAARESRANCALHTRSTQSDRQTRRGRPRHDRAIGALRVVKRYPNAGRGHSRTSRTRESS